MVGKEVRGIAGSRGRGGWGGNGVMDCMGFLGCGKDLGFYSEFGRFRVVLLDF